MYGEIRGFAHAVRNVKPFDEIAILRDAEHGGRDGIHRHNVTVIVDGQSGNNVDVADHDALHKLAGAGKDLHAGALGSAVAHNDLAGGADDGHLTRVPHLAFFFARIAKIVFVDTVLVKDLNF